MNELIKISESGKGNPVVNARDLHVFLEVGKDFSTWLKSKIKKYGFVENVDFARLFYDITGRKIGLPKNGEWTDSDFQRVHRIEYALTLSCAKELAMVQNNEKGKQARLYFIEIENRYKTLKAARELKPVVTYTMSEVVEKLKLEDFYGKIGRNRFFDILYHRKIVDKKNQPLPKYLKKGYFILKPSKIVLVTETGFGWMNQMFSVEKSLVEKTGDNTELKNMIGDLQNKYADLLNRQIALQEKNDLVAEGAASIADTLIYNKGGNHTEDKNRENVANLKSFVDRVRKNPKALGE
jgi:phage anti-repressor protein